MDFVKATDRLTNCATHADVAEVLGVSLPAVRQARMDPTSTGFRHPPEGWEPKLAQLARQKAAELVKLAEALEGS